MQQVFEILNIKNGYNRIHILLLNRHWWCIGFVQPELWKEKKNKRRFPKNKLNEFHIRL